LAEGYGVADAETRVRCATHPHERRPVSAMVKVYHRGEEYYVCCSDCAVKFRADPEFWIKGLREVEQAAGP
jgi:YHS domain-containing protein